MSGKISGWDDTIIAQATPPGAGAIGVVRLSGTRAFDIANQLFPAKDISAQPTHTLHVGYLKNGDQEIDQVVIALYRSPRSFTGEDVVEISCHGSSFVLQTVLTLCVEKGARLARPGEFTQRAFLNGKMGLTEAEAVADMIATENASQHKLALQQMKGLVHRDLDELRQQLIHFAALLELELDFSQEDVAFADRTELNNLLHLINDHLLSLQESFYYGNAVKNGVVTVIAGRPNAGKSTLLNTLLGDDRAIVSAIPGTTRDTIEELLVIKGLSFRLIDTAGLRNDTTDEIEKIGITRTRQSIDKAAVLIYVFDMSVLTIQDILDDMHRYFLPGMKLLLVGNKSDLLDEDALSVWMHNLQLLHQQNIPYNFTGISAREKKNINTIPDQLYQYVLESTVGGNQVVITNTRHYEAITKSLEALQRAREGMEQGLSSDLLAPFIRESLYYLGTITGEVETDRDILGTIFGKFCIGK